MKTSIVKISVLAVLIFGSAACSKAKKTRNELPPDFSQQQKTAQAFEKANAQFDAGDFSSAAKSFDKILVRTPVSTLDGLILFNSGLAYQQDGNCEVAVKRFRKLIRFAKTKKVQNLLLRAKLKLSDAYSCLGQTDKAMVLLIDIFKFRKSLPPELGLAEIPAKLAAGYSRIGNRKMAERYFKIADQGLRIIEARNSKKVGKKNLMSKTLFTMGDTSQVQFDYEKPKSYFRTIRTLQKYLLRSVTYQAKPWSEKAQDQIIDAYGATWKMVDQIKAPEGLSELRAKKAVKEKRSAIVQEALESLQSLEIEKVPGSKSAPINELFDRVQKTKLKMRNFLVAEAPGAEYTKEALKLKKPRREGRVKSEETVLERKQKRNRK